MKAVVEIEIGGHELFVDIDYTPYDPGNTSGPPELCYPPEGGEIEVQTIRLMGTPASKTQPPIWLDISDLIHECGGDDLVQELVDEKYERPSEADGDYTDDDRED